MTGEQLMRLHENPLYVQTYEFFLQETDRLSDMMEAMSWTPKTSDERNAIKRQFERLNETRLVLEQCRELVMGERSVSATCKPLSSAQSR